MMDIVEIMQCLPHRHPFLLVDRVTELEPGKYIAGYKNVSINEDFFQGHFPGKPVMPGVLVLEALAQISGLLGMRSSQKGETFEQVIHYFAGADKVRFKRPVVPGDQLMLESSLLADRHNIWKFSCKATVAGELVCAAEIMTAGRPRR